ncbi:hypothetical protein [Luteolibacter soli]|uniref:DUF4234 domain-containing protein n=1 Tax=Luteolibacter soli TaxID=3135280 RepID=A0ABU9B1Q8_9BACT
MSFSLPQVLAAFGSLVYFVVQWAGIVFLRRSSARLPWWLMFSGLLVGTLTSIYFIVGPMIGLSRFGNPRIWEWWSMASRLGGVAFAVGFTLYALQMARAFQRQAELEQLVAAMSEDMDRLRSEGSRPS